MKDKGIFRGIKKAVAGVFSKTKHYPDPEFTTKKRYHKPKLRVIKPPVLPCEPGTIAYHDMLVRKFGRVKAEMYRSLYISSKQNRTPLVLPAPAELAVADWAWRS